MYVRQIRLVRDRRFHVINSKGGEAFKETRICKWYLLFFLIHQVFKWQNISKLPNTVLNLHNSVKKTFTGKYRRKAKNKHTDERIKKQNTLINTIHAKTKKASLEPPQLIPSAVYKYSHFFESNTIFSNFMYMDSYSIYCFVSGFFD